MACCIAWERNRATVPMIDFTTWWQPALTVIATAAVSIFGTLIVRRGQDKTTAIEKAKLEEQAKEAEQRLQADYASKYAALLKQHEDLIHEFHTEQTASFERFKAVDAKIEVNRKLIESLTKELELSKSVVASQVEEIARHVEKTADYERRMSECEQQRARQEEHIRMQDKKVKELQQQILLLQGPRQPQDVSLPTTEG